MHVSKLGTGKKKKTLMCDVGKFSSFAYLKCNNNSRSAFIDHARHHSNSAFNSSSNSPSWIIVQ